MQTIFLATDRDGVCFVYWAGEPLWDGSDFGVGYGNAFCRYSGPCTPPPGKCREYRLVPVGDADEKDARIAELEAKLAERLPGVMPECVGDLLTACQFLDSIDAEGAKLVQHEADKVREYYYAQPFVFTGEPGIYRTDSGKCCDVFQYGKKLLGIIDDNDRVWVSSDGTFPGGRIVGRVSNATD